MTFPDSKGERREADQFIGWMVGRYLVVVLVLVAFSVGLGAVFSPLVASTQRRTFVQSVQYSSANTQAFEVDLSAYKKIDVQLSRVDPNSPEATALRAQQEFLENEMHRKVQQIPQDARTPDMMLFQ